jgi:hypothetical protein
MFIMCFKIQGLLYIFHESYVCSNIECILRHVYSPLLSILSPLIQQLGSNPLMQRQQWGRRTAWINWCGVWWSEFWILNSPLRLVGYLILLKVSRQWKERLNKTRYTVMILIDACVIWHWHIHRPFWLQKVVMYTQSYMMSQFWRGLAKEEVCQTGDEVK